MRGTAIAPLPQVKRDKGDKGDNFDNKNNFVADVADVADTATTDDCDPFETLKLSKEGLMSDPLCDKASRVRAFVINGLRDGPLPV